MQRSNIFLISVIGVLIYNEVQKNRIPKIKLRKKIPGNFNALCIPLIGIFINELEKNNKGLINHELIHWKQYQRKGLIKFYSDYLKLHLNHGYDLNPMELEARANENNFAKFNYTFAIRNGYSNTTFNPNFRK